MSEGGRVRVAPSPLVGRQRELTVLLEAVTDAGNALVGGPAGVGKTRLLAEFAGRPPRGMSCVSISGSEAVAAIPLAPLLQFVASDSPQPARAILTEFYRRSRESPIVLLVDDAHALDAASAALVHQLCRAQGVPVIAAVRTGEPAPEQIDAIWRDGLAVDVALAPLDRAASDELVSEMLGASTAGLLEQVWDRCRGHPLFVRELLDGARRTGTVALFDGVWDVLGDLALPGRLQGLLRRRLAAVSARERRLLASQRSAELNTRSTPAGCWPSTTTSYSASTCAGCGAAPGGLGRPFPGPHRPLPLRCRSRDGLLPRRRRSLAGDGHHAAGPQPRGARACRPTFGRPYPDHRPRRRVRTPADHLDDTEEALKGLLHDAFAHVALVRVGAVAIFAVRQPHHHELDG